MECDGLDDDDRSGEADSNGAEQQPQQDDSKPDYVRTGGTRIKIYEDEDNDNEPTFKILGRSKSANRTTWIEEVVDFLNELQNLVIQCIPEADLPVLTEHQRDKVIWRAHPNFQGRGPWKDWVLVDWGAYGVLPCHIWCFVDLSNLDSGGKTIEFGGIKLKPGAYAVVESSEYVKDEEEVAKSDFFIPLVLDVEGIDEDGDVTGRQFYLADVEAFVGPCSVIPNIGGAPNEYLQVKPRREWAKMFASWLQKPHKEDVMKPRAADPQGIGGDGEQNRGQKRRRREKM